MNEMETNGVDTSRWFLTCPQCEQPVFPYSYTYGTQFNHQSQNSVVYLCPRYSGNTELQQCNEYFDHAFRLAFDSDGHYQFEVRLPDILAAFADELNNSNSYVIIGTQQYPLDRVLFFGEHKQWLRIKLSTQAFRTGIRYNYQCDPHLTRSLRYGSVAPCMLFLNENKNRNARRINVGNYEDLVPSDRYMVAYWEPSEDDQPNSGFQRFYYGTIDGMGVIEHLQIIGIFEELSEVAAVPGDDGMLHIAMVRLSSHAFNEYGLRLPILEYFV